VLHIIISYDIIDSTKTIRIGTLHVHTFLRIECCFFSGTQGQWRFLSVSPKDSFLR